MSDKVKIIGGDTSSKILKIPIRNQFPIQFKPDFLQDTNEDDRRQFIQDRLRLFIFDPANNPDELITTFTPIMVGEEVVFNLNTGRTIGESETPIFSQNVYLARVVKTDNEEDANDNEEIFSEFVFQVVDETSDNTSDTIFSLFQSLPDDLNNLKDLRVGLKRTEREQGPDAALWRSIKERVNAYSFKQYQRFMNSVCGGDYNSYEPLDYEGKEVGADRSAIADKIIDLERKRKLPFTDTDSYRTIKVLTEAFLLANCATDLTSFKDYSLPVEGGNGISTIPFLEIIRRKLNDLAIKPKEISQVLDLFRNEPIPSDGNIPDMEPQDCYGILQESLTNPCFIELIWNYWHEESMLVQSVNAITRRFQNVRGPQKQDPLAGMEIAPLRPLNNLLWGYIQDEQNRLTIQRRAYEYDHHYGFSIQGKAVRTLRSADSRANFLEAFHNLLHLCAKFYKQEDDTTKVPDGYPILTSLRETHLLLSQGMHNQYGDLPFTSRVEMMMQQWMLARPEFREFLPTRTMTAYPEPWMDRVSAMNQIQGWTNTSPVSFSYLGIYGETILLSIRFGNWADSGANSDMASFWASFFRNEIQGYIHAYRVVTGVDLTTTNPQTGKIDFKAPSIHLKDRLRAQKRNAS